ncbi:MAG: DHH family phosphoesterase [Candidatus Omnitrophica bacterium CG11_big_fil_rev_8_21_14_0_20_64_10]|nr:MAG: DHH family phosphoesterase [Candidatus Omnitrophica bacterium CG11_big_fil_rev_8_21_14_0_20_64_10]
MSWSTVSEAVRVIRKHSRFLISAHVNPDPDAMGSALALAGLLKRLGKKVLIANEGGIPPALGFLPKTAAVTDRRTRFDPQAAMTVDVPILSRLGNMASWVEETPVVVNIDHHISNRSFGTVNFVDPSAGATGEMVHRLYRAFRVRPSAKEAFCMYVAIVTDTGSFRYANSSPAVHRIAAELIETGVRPLAVSQALYETYTPQDLRFLGEVLRRIRHSPDGRIAWVEVPRALVRRHGAGPEIEDELVNYPRSIRTAEVAMVFREAEEPGRIRVNFRSKGRVDVNRIARVFGGGGHAAAAGCSLPGTLAAIRPRVLREVRSVLAKRKR